MTHREYQARQDELDEQHDQATKLIVGMGCVAITLSWLALLAHWSGWL